MKKEEMLPEGILAIRSASGANCSSVGSVVDVLFAAAAISATIVAASAALSDAYEEQVKPDSDDAEVTKRNRVRLRPEPFGAWVRLQKQGKPPVLLAVDHSLAKRLGASPYTNKPEGTPSPPLEVHMAVTAKCSVACVGCYLDATPTGAVPTFEEITHRLHALAEAGVFTVAFGGGEPLSRPDIGALGRYARSLGLTPVLTTSGAGLTQHGAKELTAFEQVNVSYDGIGETYEAVRGVKGSSLAEKAMELLANANVLFGINLVLTQKSFEQVEATALRARALGAAEVQLLRFKPAGRGAGLTYYAMRLSYEQTRQVYPLAQRLVRTHGLSVRIDCSLLPFFSSHLQDAELLKPFGIFGCEAARHLAAVDVNGSVSPCSFLPPSSLPVSRLSHRTEWSSEPVLQSVRNFSTDAPEPCASCPLQTVCRGGCRVVAKHAGNENEPDPECPRVQDFRNHRQPEPCES